MKKVFITLGVILGAILLLIGVWFPYLKPQIEEIGRLQTGEITMFTTSTLAQYLSDNVSNISDFRHVEIIMAATTASGTLKFACSNQATKPTFSSAQSATNRWDYVQVVDKEDGSTIDGDTGITLSDTSDVRQFEINDNYCKWFKPLLTGNTTPAGYGTTSVYIYGASNL